MERINGIDTAALRGVIEEVGRNASKGIVGFHVTSRWQGGTKSEASVNDWKLAGQSLARNFRIQIDEPLELLGENTAPNPQEFLMAALNACMMVGYVAGASMRGIRLDRLEIETDGELDLRGFLGLDDSVRPGYDELRYTVRIKGDGTPEQFHEIHEAVVRTSPNRWNIANPIRLASQLVVE